MATTTLNQRNDTLPSETSTASRGLFWWIAMAIIVVLAVAYSMTSNRNIGTIRSDQNGAAATGNSSSGTNAGAATNDGGAADQNTTTVPSDGSSGTNNR